MEIDFKPVVAEIEAANKIGLITHVLGDGDAFGSLLGLQNILEQLGKKVVIFSNETFGQQLKFLEKTAEYEPTEKFEKVDLLIALDTANLARLTCPNVFKEAQKNKVRTVIIDHHSWNDLYNEVDIVVREENISSTSEIIFWLSQDLEMKLDRETAEYLLIGIETDTNFLQNPNTVNNTTYRAKAELLKLGARIKNITEKLKESNTVERLKFNGAIVKRAKLNKGYGILMTYITKDDQKKYDINPGISSEIANFLDQTRDAKVVLVAEQREGDTVKVSMRSNNSSVNVAKLASFFGGGGHAKAAGFEIKGRIEDII